jgi:hypothetical protein
MIRDIAIQRNRFYECHSHSKSKCKSKLSTYQESKQKKMFGAVTLLFSSQQKNILSSQNRLRLWLRHHLTPPLPCFPTDERERTRRRVLVLSGWRAFALTSSSAERIQKLPSHTTHTTRCLIFISEFAFIKLVKCKKDPPRTEKNTK